VGPGAQQKQEVNDAGEGAVEEAPERLDSEFHRAAQMRIKIQRLSLWRVAWQHVPVALVTWNG
jgi:hypothetical protein